MNTIYSCGAGSGGKLGLGPTFTHKLCDDSGMLANENQPEFQRLQGLPQRPVEGSSGLGHSVLLMADGSVFACGNGHGVGRGITGYATDWEPADDDDTFEQWSFERVELADSKKAAQVECGLQYTFILSTDGCLFAAGTNELGELGRGRCRIGGHIGLFELRNCAECEETTIAAFHWMCI